MPLFYIPAELRYSAATSEALKQLNEEICKITTSDNTNVQARRADNDTRFKQRMQQLEKAALPVSDLKTAGQASVAIAALSRALPKDRFVLSESITKCVNSRRGNVERTDAMQRSFPAVLNHLEIDDARRYASSGASSLGYHGG